MQNQDEDARALRSEIFKVLKRMYKNTNLGNYRLAFCAGEMVDAFYEATQKPWPVSLDGGDKDE